MKKMVLIAAALLIAGITFGHGNGWSSNNKKSTENSEQNWQQMNTWQQVMHETKVDVNNSENGVNLTIILPSEEAQKVVTEDFELTQQNLASYFESVDISLKDQEKGWLISFSAKDSDLIKKLQYSGSGLWYEFIQQKMIGKMHLKGRNFPKGGQHHMGGFNNGHMGQGPGMRGGDYQGCPGGGQGMYKGNIQDSSNMGPGMMNNGFNNIEMM